MPTVFRTVLFGQSKTVGIFYERMRSKAIALHISKITLIIIKASHEV